MPSFLGTKKGPAALAGAIVCLVMLAAYCVFQVRSGHCFTRRLAIGMSPLPDSIEKIMHHASMLGRQALHVLVASTAVESGECVRAEVARSACRPGHDACAPHAGRWCTRSCSGAGCSAPGSANLGTRLWLRCSATCSLWGPCSTGMVRLFFLGKFRV